MGKNSFLCLLGPVHPENCAIPATRVVKCVFLLLYLDNGKTDNGCAGRRRIECSGRRGMVLVSLPLQHNYTSYVERMTEEHEDFSIVT